MITHFWNQKMQSTSQGQQAGQLLLREGGEQGGITKGHKAPSGCDRFTVLIVEVVS